jgi:hypothetical protein
MYPSRTRLSTIRVIVLVARLIHSLNAFMVMAPILPMAMMVEHWDIVTPRQKISLLSNATKDLIIEDRRSPNS